MPKFKKLTDERRQKIEDTIKMLLHANRDYMRNKYAQIDRELSEVDTKMRSKQWSTDVPCDKTWIVLNDEFNRLKDRRNRYDTRRVTSGIYDPYYCEAFGILRTLDILGYGSLHRPPENTYHDLRRWFEQLEKEVLKEEGFYDNTHKCDFCVEHYGKDGAGRTRSMIHA